MPSPVAEYLLREGSGITAHDTSGNGRDGTLAGGAFIPTWAAKGLQFSSSGSSTVNLPDATLANDNTSITDYSLEAWVSSDGSTPGGVITTPGASMLADNPGGPLVWEGLAIGTFFGIVDSIATVPANVFTHVVFVRSGTSLLIYVNGSHDQTAAVAAGPVHMIGHKSLGADTVDSFGGFVGILGEARIYNVALSAGDVTATYNASAGRYVSAPTLACVTSPAGKNVPYSQPLVASGGTPPYTAYAITAGSLPPGLSLDTGTGVISGTPTTVGSYSYTAQVTDSTPTTGSQSCTLVVAVFSPEYLVIQQDHDDGTAVYQVFKSQDHGLTWNEMDAANHPTSSGNAPSGYYKFGSKFIQFTLTHDPAAANRVIRFNLEPLDTWGSYSSDSPAPGQETWTTWRPNGDMILLSPVTGFFGLNFTVSAGGGWTGLLSIQSNDGFLYPVYDIWMDDATGCLGILVEKLNSSAVFQNFQLYVLKPDNSVVGPVTLSSTDLTQTTPNSIVAFQGKWHIGYQQGKVGGVSKDMAVAISDSLTAPTVFTNHVINSTYLDGFVAQGFVIPSNDGNSLIAVWDVKDTRTMPDAIEAASLVTSTSSDGTTWSAPSVYWQPPLNSPFLAGLGTGADGAGTAQIANAVDLGTGEILMSIWRHSKDNGTGGTAQYNLYTDGSGNRKMILLEDGSVTPFEPFPFNYQFLASGWGGAPFQFVPPLVTPYYVDDVYGGIGNYAYQLG